MNPFFNPLLRKMDVGPDAGENVSVTGNTVNFIGGGTEGAVYNAGAGLTLEGNVFTAHVATVGFGMELSGGTASYARYRNIETVTGSSVTLQAGHAYKVYATSAAITINTENIPANMYGQEGHLEVFVAGTGYVQTGTNVVLANALEPDAVNNCTVRFHDGLAIISVEDHVAGYIVVSATGSTAGTLPYALSSASQEYVAFDAALNGSMLDMGGAVTNSEKHVVGNGYTETIVSGGINCTSKTTFANLGMNGVVVSSGTLTLGDVYIPNGATVAVSGGGLAIEKVTGNGGTIDLNGTNMIITTEKSTQASGVVFTGGSAAVGGVMNTAGKNTFNSCTFSANTAGSGGAFYIGSNGNVTLSSCSAVSNTAPGGAFAYIFGGSMNLTDCSIDTDQNITIRDGTVTVAGSNTLGRISNVVTAGTVLISSGAIVDLTGNTNATPINPGGGVTFAPGGATILTGGTTGVVDAQYMLGGMTVPQIGNTNLVNLSGTRIAVDDSDTIVSNCIFSGISGITGVGGGALYFGSGGTAVLTDCLFINNYNSNGGNAFGIGSKTVTISNCSLPASGVSGTAVTQNVIINTGGKLYLAGGNEASTIQLQGLNTELVFTGVNSIARVIGYNGGTTSGGSVTISSGASINLTSSITPGGGIVVSGGTCTINGVPIEPTAEGSAYTSIINSGGTLYIDGEVVP